MKCKDYKRAEVFVLREVNMKKDKDLHREWGFKELRDVFMLNNRVLQS